MNEVTSERGGLGQELRRLRHARGFRIADLAARTGRSTGWISQVERDRSRPGYDDLLALARAFDMPLSQLFRREIDPALPEADVLRAAQRRALPADSGGAADDMLVPVLDGIQFYRSELGARSASERPARRGGVEMGYVVEGAFEIWIGRRHHALAAGDSFWARDEPIAWLNPHDTPCVVVWVLAPRADDAPA